MNIEQEAKFYSAATPEEMELIQLVGFNELLSEEESREYDRIIARLTKVYKQQ